MNGFARLTLGESDGAFQEVDSRPGSMAGMLPFRKPMKSQASEFRPTEKRRLGIHLRGKRLPVTVRRPGAAPTSVLVGCTRSGSETLMDGAIACSSRGEDRAGTQLQLSNAPRLGKCSQQLERAARIRPAVRSELIEGEAAATLGSSSARAVVTGTIEPRLPRAAPSS